MAMDDQEYPLLDDHEVSDWPEHVPHKRSYRWRCEWLTKSLLPSTSHVLMGVCCLVLLSLLLLLDTAAVSVSRDLVSSSNTVAELAIRLHPQDHAARPPRTTYTSWVVARTSQSPDGVQKDLYVINGQFPGPTIECRPGDTLVINVTNAIDEPLSIHWHGLHMRGANDMDGPAGVTQCAIPPGGHFVYRIPAGNQTGTFWYHAHSQVQRADGLYGGFVIHSTDDMEPSQHQHPYDEDRLFLVGDWYHQPAQDVLGVFLDPSSDGNEPCPDSFLVNGRGHFTCSRATPARPVNCSEVQLPQLSLDRSRRHRLRFVNVGSLLGFRVAMPDAELQLATVDGGLDVADQPPVQIVGVVYPAQRVDLILSWPEDAQSRAAASEMVLDMDDEYFLFVNPALTPTQTFSISTDMLETSGNRTATAVSSTATLAALDLRNVTGPALAAPLPLPQRVFMISAAISLLSHNGFVPQAQINHTQWTPLKTNRALLALDQAEWEDDHQLVSWTGRQSAWVELTINNMDTQGHPFHLHGFDFYVIGSHEANGGWDYYNPFTPEKPPRGGPFNTDNPLQRDTIYVPPYGYVVIRFHADNEGLWILHCHILWHQASGMMMAFQVLGTEDGLRQSEAGSRAEEYCRSLEK